MHRIMMSLLLLQHIVMFDQALHIFQRAVLLVLILIQKLNEEQIHRKQHSLRLIEVNKRTHKRELQLSYNTPFRVETLSENFLINMM